jgi:hypothetical protein
VAKYWLSSCIMRNILWCVWSPVQHCWTGCHEYIWKRFDIYVALVQFTVDETNRYAQKEISRIVDPFTLHSRIMK